MFSFYYYYTISTCYPFIVSVNKSSVLCAPTICNETSIKYVLGYPISVEWFQRVPLKNSSTYSSNYGLVLEVQPLYFFFVAQKEYFICV